MPEEEVSFLAISAETHCQLLVLLAWEESNYFPSLGPQTSRLCGNYVYAIALWVVFHSGSSCPKEKAKFILPMV